MTATRERPAALDVSGLNVSYARGGRRLRALEDVTFRIEPGESYGLVGESGSGKTTLALALMRHLPRAARVDGGRVLLGGDDMLAAGRRTLRRWRVSRIALVPQGAGGALNPALQVGTQLSEVYRAHGNLLPAEAVEAAARMLAEVRVGDPGRVLARYPHELSAGQQQRVLIAMALAANPDVLILDEPTTALDATVEAEVLDLVEALQGEIGAAILLISHDIRVVARLCDRIGMLYAGRLVEEGPAEGVVASPRHPYTAALLRCVPKLDARGASERLEPIPGRAPDLGPELGGCSFAGRCSMAKARCEEEAPAARPVASGWTSRCHFHADVPAIAAARPVSRNGAPSPSGEAPLLRVERLSKTYDAGEGRVQAVTDVSFDLRHGEVLALVGESGSGKTSVARCLAGLSEPSGGSLEIGGRAIPWLLNERPRDARRALQMVFQNPDGALNRAVTVGVTLRRALRAAGDRRPAERALDELAALVHLSRGDLDLRLRALSGGMKQRAAIAHAFAGSPRIVICDEPVSDLDVSVQAAILNLVRELGEREGVSYLFISHDLAVVRYVADRIGVMYMGSLVELRAARAFFDAPLHPYTEALVSAVPTLPSDDRRPRITLYGPLPSPRRPPAGCRFHTRCPRFLGDICRTAEPPWQEDSSGNRYRCHIAPDSLAGLQRADRLAGRPPTRNDTAVA